MPVVMMKDALLSFPKQFEFVPVIENPNAFKTMQKFVVCGMGGSQLAADLLKSWNPALDLVSHKDYGLPSLSDEELRTRLIITSSYSGNTEETLESFAQAVEKKLPVIAISTGGKLLELAKKYSVPYIKLPAAGIQPRCASGFNIKALLKAMGHESALEEIAGLAHTLNAQDFEEPGQDLAKKLKGFVPVIYASSRNSALAYNWKIKLNETGKTPAFCNVFPELNHNEMNSFDSGANSTHVPQKFYFVFLRDAATDHPRTLKRMEVLKKLYEERGFLVSIIELKGQNLFHKLFSAVLLVDWVSYYLAQSYGLDPEQVPMVEEFKKLIA